LRKKNIACSLSYAKWNPPVWRWVPEEGGRVKAEGEGERIWSKYFIPMYENRTMKTVDIVLRRGWNDRVNLIKVYCMHVWKYHNNLYD
jgi:hypothetical protein